MKHKNDGWVHLSSMSFYKVKFSTVPLCIIFAILERGKRERQRQRVDRSTDRQWHRKNLLQKKIRYNDQQKTKIE